MCCCRYILPIVSSLLLVMGLAHAQQFGPMMTLKELRESGVTGRVVSVAGVVTCVEKNQFFLQDETEAMQIQVWNALQVVGTGDLVVVTGTLIGQGATSQIRSTEVLRQGTRALPAPETPKPAELLTGRAHGQRVRITGVVHDISFVRGEMKLMVRADDVVFSVCWYPTDEKDQRPDDLLDAVVEVTGVAPSGLTPDGQPSTGRISLASRDDVRVIKPGSADVFQRPLKTLAAMRVELPEFQERFRIIGKVTYASPAGWFYCQDGTGTARGGRSPFLDAPPDLRRPLQVNPDLRAGDVIELVGYVFQDVPGKVMPWLAQCEWRVLRHEAPPSWEPMAAGAIIAGDFDGHSISVTGEVVATKVEKDKDGFFNHTITINDDDVWFWALVQMKSAETVPVKEGDYVRLDGVVMGIHNAEGKTERFRVNLNAFSDIHPAVKPWSVRRIGRWLLGALILCAGAAVWIVVLRRQVRRQNRKLIAANDELARFKQVADVSTDFIAMATLTNEPIYINPAGRRIVGISEDAVLANLKPSDVMPEESLAVMQNTGFPHAFRHGHWQAELNMRRLSGEVFPVSFLGLIIRGPDGKPQYIASVARDISDRHALERQLRESNNDLLRFKAIADTMNDLVAMADLDKKPLYINTAGRNLLGIGLDEDAGSIDFESIYSRESLELFEREGYAHAFQHGSWSAEITLQHRDGHEIPVLFSGLVLYKPDGSPLCMSCIAHDLTQRIRLEKQLRDSLEHERELNALKSGFVNTISHEFRTPLGIILFSSSMMRRFNRSFSPEEREAQLNAIDEAVERMNELVEQALSLGRAEVAAPKKAAFDLSRFCVRVVDEVMSATRHRCPISLEGMTEMPPAFTDETMLRTILANLLNNAVKYSPVGSPIVMKVEKRGDEQAIFTIRDHGRGLNEDDIPKLFTTFYRGHDVQDIPGSGLGLAIVKRCTETLAGTVVGRNAPDGGAEFIVSMPLFTKSSL